MKQLRLKSVEPWQWLLHYYKNHIVWLWERNILNNIQSCSAITHPLFFPKNASTFSPTPHFSPPKNPRFFGRPKLAAEVTAPRAPTVIPPLVWMKTPSCPCWRMCFLAPIVAPSVDPQKNCLVVTGTWLVEMTFPSYWEWNVIIPTNSIIFQRGRYTTHQI